MEDLVSVVVPVYNGEKYLRETLFSILDQSYKNLEIILIDDGSTDNSLSILKEFEKLDNRVIVLSQNNVGTSFTMKKAVAFSNGKYIVRSDQDDISHRDRIKKQLKYLINNDYDMVGCYYKSFGNGNRILKYCIENFVNRPINNYKDQYIRYCNGSCIYGGSIAIKSDVIKKVNPFNKQYIAMEDGYIYVSIHNAGYKIGIIPEVLYHYRVHLNNTSSNRLYRRNLYPQYFDVLFKDWYRDRFLKYKNVVVIKREEEELLIREVFSKYYNDLNIRFVNENNFNEFISNDIYEYKPENSIFFIGGMFLGKTQDILIKKGFKYYDNLFMVIDCYV